MGDKIKLLDDHATAKITTKKNGAVIAEATLKTPVFWTAPPGRY